MIYKCDLHLHSKFSNKSSIWALRKVNCPESFTTPEYIYNTLSQRGLDYITITDHNTIDGALEIADRPNTFISSEVTTFFPENNCKAHIVVCNITEALFDDILKIRKNIYELLSYLRENNVVHFLAHPLYDLNRKLSVDIFEKMLLLFNVFEVKNGSRSERFNSLIEKTLLNLTKERIESLANKHNIDTYGSQPWIKGIVGGSDDHSGYFMARAYTMTRNGGTLREFMDSINSHETWVGGDNGDSLTLAHSIYGIGYRFFEERFKSKKNTYSPVSMIIAKRLFNANSKKLSITDKIRLFINKNFFISNNGVENASFEKILDIELINLFSDSNFVEKYILKV